MSVRTDLYARIVAAKCFIDEHFAGELTLDRLAGKALLSPYHFHRLFVAVYRRTPHQYLTFRRMEKARALLGDDLPVHEVCEAVGYGSLPSFSTLFRRETGSSPLAYQKEVTRKKIEQEEEPKRVMPFCFRAQYGI